MALVTSNGCSDEVEELNAQNVMFCQNGPLFQRPSSLFSICQALSPIGTANPFGTFCIFPPAEGRMVSMCAAFNDQNHLFFNMADAQITSLDDIPRVISYPNLNSSLDF